MNPAPNVILVGPMGAGKTTLITALCKILGVQDRVNSPTFAIMNEYQGLGKVIYHMDWYRLENDGEARRAGVEMAMEDSDYCFIEWPEKIENLLPEHTIWVYIRKNEDDTRTFTVKL